MGAVTDIVKILCERKLLFDAHISFKGADAAAFKANPFGELGRTWSGDAVCMALLYGKSLHAVVVQASRGVIWNDVDEFPRRLYGRVLNVLSGEDGHANRLVAMHRILWY